MMTTMKRRSFLAAAVVAGSSAFRVNAGTRQGDARKPRSAPDKDEIEIASEIADTAVISRTDDRAWLVTQQRARHEGPAGSRPPDYAQAPVWLKIHNPGAPRAISVILQWIDFGYMAYRKWGYLKHADAYKVLTGQISPGKTAYRFEVPPGTSWFGPVPWHGNEDAGRFLERIASSHPSVCIRSIGKTKQGRDIRCLTLGDEKAGPPLPNVLIVGREHGGETSGSFAVEAIVEHILSGEFPPELRNACCYHVVPIANPDGVANGTKLPQRGPVELSDLHYASMTARDPTCVALREETLRLRPACYLNYHSYLFPAPQLIFYGKEEGMIMLDSLIGTDPARADGWYVLRQAQGGNTTLNHCYRTFGSIIGLIELPWAGRKPEDIRAQGVATFRAAMTALMARGRGRNRTTPLGRQE
jgi:hypothetical protein